MNPTASSQSAVPRQSPTVGRGRLVTDWAELQAYAADWDRLWQANPQRRVFGSFAFAKAWYEAYQDAVHLFTPVTGEPGNAAGILPLVVENGRLRFLGYSAFDYNDVLCEPRRCAEVLEALLGALIASPGGWRSGRLENVPAESLLARHLPALPGGIQRQCRLVHAADCPALVLQGGDREQILHRLLVKKSLRRHENKLARLGRLDFHHVEDKQEILELLPCLFEQHVRRRALAGGRSRFLRRQERDFFRLLVETLGGKRPLRFSVLAIDDRPVAFHLGFESGGKFLWYLPAFDVNRWDYSPGEVLIRSLLRYVSEHPIRELDFTIGGEGFKSRFANQVRKNLTLFLRPPGVRGRLYLAGIRSRESLKRHAPRLFRWFKRAHQAVQAASAADLAGRFIEHRVAYREEFHFYRASSRAGAEPVAGRAPYEKPTLAELAELSLHAGAFLDATRLREAARRFQRGDVAWILWHEGKPVELCWTGRRDHLEVSGDAGNLQIPVEGPVWLISESWTPPASHRPELATELFRHLAAEAGRRGLDAWIGCRARHGARRRAIERAGFEPMLKVVRRRLLGQEQTIIQRVDPTGSDPIPGR